MLQTERMMLRKYRMEDAQVLYREIGLDPEMIRYSGWNPYATKEMARETVQRFINSNEQDHSYSWVMDMDHTVVGIIGAYDYQDDQIEVGFSVIRRYWGKGLASEALKRVLEYLSEHEKIFCITA